MTDTPARAATSFGDAPAPMFDDPPKCWLHKRSNFITSFFPQDKNLKPDVDYDFFGRQGEIKIVAMDRNDDMLPYIEDGTIVGAVAQKSYLEAYLTVHLLHWLNTNAMVVVPDWKAAGVNPLPESVSTGVMPITKANVAQFKH